MGEPTLKEKYEDIRRRYDSMCEAADKNQEQVGKLAAENSSLKNTVIRLGAEMTAAQQNVQLLGDDFNERSRKFGDEITRLTYLLKDNGIDPEDD